MLDNDEEGIKARKNFIRKYHTNYDLHPFTTTKKDVGEMSLEEIKDTIGKKWSKV